MSDKHHAAPIDTAVFDLGNVLIRWNPRNLYRKLFGDDIEAMETFLAQVCPTAWNEQQDQGRTWQEAIAEAVARHPDQETLIRAYRERWEEMLDGAIEETVTILNELHANGIRLLALTNWSAETFPIALQRFEFLQRFEGILVSGAEGVIKPSPEIFQRFQSRYNVASRRAVFIDDHRPNIEGAQRMGFHGIQFFSAQQLRSDLLALGLPLDVV
ncbi:MULTISPECIES: HAD family phosphatase [unclassified Pseudomonas]|uniref:HAD family hydrolase n=1 Tax=unclassified Pseudomonas TaxID=196821 RepID=UPI002AC895B9|nr:MULTISPECIES: HAD family phosphatase [unclassified Pseudomonas]MEB0047813.1 HAD family phosphatase [Pseudomonas sp. Dout3]MEB0098327.1 HAD family phosphatase [Pseudomonas sp. DC1.2]WPX57115.1 HAD family phosphatase [Pseudomonas sp. DC1.2]